MKTRCFCFAVGDFGLVCRAERATGWLIKVLEPCSSTSSNGLRGSDFTRRPPGLLPAAPLLVSFGGCDSSGLCALSLGASFDAQVLGDCSSLWTPGMDVVLSGFASAGTWTDQTSRAAMRNAAMSQRVAVRPLMTCCCVHQSASGASALVGESKTAGILRVVGCCG